MSTRFTMGASPPNPRPSRSRSSNRSRALAALSIAAWLSGCKPRAGDACEGNKVVCRDDKNELVCQDGRLASFPCKGPKGCSIAGETLTCDISGNAPGDPCAESDEGAATCLADGKHKIACKEGSYVVRPCRGPGGCKDLTCDTSVVQAGDPCDITGLLCSVDGKAALRCKGGAWVKERDCAKPCKLDGDRVDCEALEKPAPQVDNP